MFNQPYSKEPIIEYVKHRSFVKKEVLQLEGQMSLEGTENE